MKTFVEILNEGTSTNSVKIFRKTGFYYAHIITPKKTYKSLGHTSEMGAIEWAKTKINALGLPIVYIHQTGKFVNK